MKNLIQIKEVNLDVGEMITSSKVKTSFAAPEPPSCAVEDLFFGKDGGSSTSWQVRVRHFAESKTTSQPPAVLGGQRHGLPQANRERNAPNPALANFSSHACCHTGHTVTHIKTLEILKTRGAKQGSACRRKTSSSVFEAPLWKRLALGPLCLLPVWKPVCVCHL